MNRMMAPPVASKELLPLSPVELAYLLRDGDMNHCAAVLVVDLIHRSVKVSDGTNIDAGTALYKQQILNAVKGYLRSKAEQKAQEVVDWRNLKNPAGIVSGVRQIHFFFTSRLKPFVTEIVRDPRHLKRYFNPAGILRILVDLYAAGVKSSLEADLTAQLISRGIIVRESVRIRHAKSLWILAVLGSLVLIAILFSVFQGILSVLAFTIAVSALFNGSLIRTLMAARGFLPFYEEVALVLKSVVRPGFRLQLARVLFGSARTIFWFAVWLVTMLLIGIQSLMLWGIAHSQHFEPAIIPIIFLIVSSACAFIIADAAHTAVAVRNTPQPTIAGAVSMRYCQKGLAELSPIAIMSESFSNGEYDERLSMLVALYGIETLWFLL
ncbi:MAG: hypothetical protein K2W95_26610 [Candidatus Obscuribacterales bacterium]|nr:hypothetical protein [Candidatus Obscuribacterales bacterium]